jgi:Nitrate and nitrite sensing
MPRNQTIFKNLTVRSKLMAVLGIPVMVMLLLVASRVTQDVESGRRADRLTRLTAYAGRLVTLTHQLQRERDLAAGYLAGGRSSGRERLLAQQARVQQAAGELAAAGAKVDLRRYHARLRAAMPRAGQALARLPERRVALDQPYVPAAQALDDYTAIIGALLDVEAAVPAEFDRHALDQGMTNLERLSRYQEAAAFEASDVYALLSAGSQQAGREELDRISAVEAAGDAWRSDFQAFATSRQRALLGGALGGQQASLADQLRRQVLPAPDLIDLRVDPQAWLAATTAQADRVGAVELRLVADTLAGVAADRAAANRSALAGSALLLLALVSSVGISLFMSRSMIRSLQQLKRSARDLVERQLPLVVERLQRLEAVGDLDLEPPQRARPPGGRSEIGEVAEAFGAVRRVAVRVATEQAALHKSVGDMFLNFARRNQALIDRQLQLIGEFQQRRRRPAVPQEFVRLDRLATHMRRNAEDLVVLSGARLPRRWGGEVALTEVIRSALGDVEDDQRVEVEHVDDLAILAEAASDLVHVLAELLENATAFSPPHTTVHVGGEAVSGGYVLEIEDHGIGMSDLELLAANERLANPTGAGAAGVSLQQRLGLNVVARLGARHRIKVQLRHSWYDGLTALVLIPNRLIVRMRREPLLQPVAAGDEPARARPAPAPRHAAPDVRLPIFEAVRSDWLEDRAPGPPGRPRERSPEDVRRRLRLYRQGLERGRQEATEAKGEGSPPTPEG